jgi:hypothetical protein
MLLKTLVCALSLSAAAVAWNTDVHNQIGVCGPHELSSLLLLISLQFMAEKLISHETNAVLQQILEPIYNGSIGQAAAWADSFAHTPEGAFSFQWHWMYIERSIST